MAGTSSGVLGEKMCELSSIGDGFCEVLLIREKGAHSFQLPFKYHNVRVSTSSTFQVFGTLLWPFWPVLAGTPPQTRCTLELTSRNT